MKAQEIFVEGRVQGVGFRYYTLHQAELYNIRGYVKNLVDGSVKILAIGDDDSIKFFVNAVQIGPRFSSVTNIVLHTITLDSIPENFTILY